MKCPVCWSEGLAIIRFRDMTEGRNGMIYKKYSCSDCDTDYTVMYRHKDINEKLEKLIIARHHIQAIKLHRATTGWGLRESKQFCDNLRQKLINQGRMPERAQPNMFRR